MRSLILSSILTILLFQAPFQKVGAQGITMEQTLSYMNSKFGSVCQLDVIRGVIVASYYDGQEKFREDQVLCKSLDLTTMMYDSNSRIFSVDCKGSSKCVDRQLFVRKIQRDYARLSFPVTLDPKGVEGMKKAFTHMINLVLDTKYENSEPFE